MKKIFSILVLAFLFTVTSHAQSVACHYGIQGGFTMTDFSRTGAFKPQALPGWTAGFSFIVKLPAYFVLQPAINYEQNYMKLAFKDSADPVKMRQQILNIPLSLQWGPDLGICRIFAQVVPMLNLNLGVGYNNFEKNAWWTDAKNFVNLAQFGTGIGGGIDIWRFQLNLRYNWFFNDWKTSVADNPFSTVNGSKRSFTMSLIFIY